MSQISRLRDAEISNGNLINADDIDAELNQLVSESNSQDTRLTNIESSAMTIAGVKTFSSAPKTDQIDERTLNAGVTIDSVLHKDGSIKLLPTAGYAPASNGELGYDSTSNTYKVMENGTAKTIHTAPLSVSAKSSAYTAVATDKGKLFVCTSTFTLSLTAAATLGSGWYCQVRNDGTGVVTIDPNASETLDNQLTINMYPGETFTIVCDGTNFKTVGRQLGWIPLLQVSASGSTSASMNFTSFITSDFVNYKFVLENIVPQTNATNLQMRVSTDGGSTWKQGASDYYWVARSDSSGASSTFGDTKVVMNYTASSDGQLSNTSSNGYCLELLMYRPSSSSSVKNFAGIGSCALNAFSRSNIVTVQGAYNATTAINGVQFFMSSGNINGTVYMLGWRQS
jgi:hypothetical protein